ncbi:MAG: type III secretion system stator protein SctL [Desulfobacteraceae bacterium]|jgi:type III secretion protein L
MEKPFQFVKSAIQVNTAKKVIKAEDYLLYIEAAEIIAKAKDEAAAITEAAKKEAESIITGAGEAYEQEKERGYQDGLEIGERKIAEEVTNTIMDTVTYLESVEKMIVETIISATKLILSEVGDEQVIKQLAQKAVHTSRDQKHIILRVSTEQASSVRQKIEELQESFIDQRYVEVIADSTRDSGTCVVETKMGSIDVSLDVQLETIRASLERRFKEVRKNICPSD